MPCYSSLVIAALVLVAWAQNDTDELGIARAENDTNADGSEDRGVVANVCRGLDHVCNQQVKIPTSAKLQTSWQCKAKYCRWRCDREVDWTCSSCSERCGKNCVGSMCTNKCCTWPCKKTLENWCTGYSKEQCGESCRNATSLEIQYQETDRCHAAKKFTMLPVDALPRLCPCLSSVGDVLADLGDDPAAWRTSAIIRGGDMLNCLMTLGFRIQDDQAAVREESIYTPGDAIIEAPVVDTGVYISLSAAIGACAGGSMCDVLADVLLTYFKRAGKQVGLALLKYLKPLLDSRLFDRVLRPSRDLVAASEELPEKIDKRAQTCGAQASAEVKQDLKEATDRVKAFVQTGDEAKEQLSEAVKKLYPLVDALTSSYLQHAFKLAEAIWKGEAPDWTDGLEYLIRKDGLREALKEVGAFVRSLSKYVANEVRGLRKKVQEAVFTAISGDCELEDSDIASVRSNSSIVEAEVAVAEKVQVDEGTVQLGVAGYRRWTFIDVFLPCSDMEKKEFHAGNLTAVSSPYPRFYKCHYRKRVPFPNEYIPYIRLKGLGDELPERLI